MTMELVGKAFDFARAAHTSRMRLIQYIASDGARAVGVVRDDGRQVAPMLGIDSTYALAMAALETGDSLEAATLRRLNSGLLDYGELLQHMRLLPPLTAPDP